MKASANFKFEKYKHNQHKKFGQKFYQILFQRGLSRNFPMDQTFYRMCINRFLPRFLFFFFCGSRRVFFDHLRYFSRASFMNSFRNFSQDSCIKSSRDSFTIFSWGFLYVFFSKGSPEFHLDIASGISPGFFRGFLH